MPTTVETPTGSTVEATRNDYALNTVGIEFEYPIAPESAESDDDFMAATQDNARMSDAIYNDRRAPNVGEEWLPSMQNIPTGEMTRDHVGAEITSARLNLHSDEPERWYRATIARATSLGYPFAANGRGGTSFGMHLHLSELSDSEAGAIHNICQEDWAPIFFCASLSEDSADPWRHGGVSFGGDFDADGHFGNGGILRNRHGDGHWEFRLPEPGVPEHFDVIMNFLRLLATQGSEAAATFARDCVFEKDERLTAVQQYNHLQSEVEGWPTEQAVRDSSDYTGERFAQQFVDIMEA